ncbi:MAG: hypothetical protein ACREGJ_04840 [Candidatus Saccharimonadales bacterium]
MRKRYTLLVITGLGLLALFISSFVPTSLVSAQAKPSDSGQALEIAPPVINLTANPGQTIKTQISLRDVSKDKLLVKGQVNDFTAAGEDGTPKIMLEDDGSDNPYSLKGWISPLPELTLKPKEIKNLPITINVPANASPGGYYGVVRFTATPPELEGTGVSLSASLGALILLRVNGDVKEGLTVEEFSVNKDGKSGWLFESTPLTFIERLKNTGNIHEQPTGQVTITDMFGRKVAAVNINLPPRNILPGSIRKFEQPLDSSVIGNKMLFGRYRADLRVTYGDSKQVVTSSLTFWVIPYRLIGLSIVILVGGFFLLRFLVKRYNRRIINKATAQQNPQGPNRTERK